uniref:Uncharacterized protein n=1 Tax=Rhizophora mucronata TaxID=61149 RepID=A0A2P2NJ72_RHIMU
MASIMPTVVTLVLRSNASFIELSIRSNQSS